jgi:signal transduction histidine kinase
VELSAEIAPDLPPAEFDPARILQVLVNLLGNAIKFTETGSVFVFVDATPTDLRFTIRDTGEGIPADKLESIFERFSQVNKNDRRGIGLGLVISRCIVEGHSGRIWAESGLGEGSTFFFTLPLPHAGSST